MIKRFIEGLLKRRKRITQPEKGPQPITTTVSVSEADHTNYEPEQNTGEDDYKYVSESTKRVLDARKRGIIICTMNFFDEEDENI